MSGTKALLFALLSLVLISRLAFVLREDEGLLAAAISDDGFYNLTIARNLAHGRGFTFDGITTTSGFHPSVVLFAVPIFAVCPDTATALRAVLLVHAVASTVLAWLLYRIVRRVAGSGPALAALLLYATSPELGILGQTMNGCDTVFAGLALAATVAFYLARIRDAASPAPGDFVVLGLALGGMCVVRLDLALFAVALVADLLWTRGRRGHPGRVLVAAAIAILPWLTLTCVLSGRPVPDNARAVRLISRAIAGVEVNLGENGLIRSLGGGLADSLQDPPVYPEDRLPLAFYTTSLQHAGLELIKIAPATGLGFTLGRLVSAGVGRTGRGPLFPALVRIGFAYLLSLALAILFSLLLLLRSGRLREISGLRSLWFLLPPSLLLVLAYGLVIHGSWSFDRYLFPVAVVTLLFTPALARLLARSWTRWMTTLFASASLALFLAGAELDLFRPAASGFYRQARLIADHLPPDAVVGASQAGHFGFFCPQPVVNLDGKVDPEAYAALRDRRVLDQARRRGVRFISDWPFLVNMLMRARSGSAAAASLRQIDPPPDSPHKYNRFGFISYAVDEPRSGRP